MSRKSTPDVLGEIMGSQPESNKAIKPASNKTVKQESTETIKIANSKAVKPASNKAELTDDEPKEKATFNLSTTVLEDLEDTWVHLKRAARGTRITKTLIVEKAILLAIKDYQERGEESEIFKCIH